MKFKHSPTLIAIAASLMLAACGGGDDDPAPAPAPEETRAHDSREFTLPTETTFAALTAAPGDTVDVTDTDRWAGALGGAAYRIEVPRNWNGKLVMYAHGYRGTGAALTVDAPPLRRHLIEKGYAWAASSYSKNWYDVRAGVEDTNALALAFTEIAAENGRPLDEPTKTFITGISMGGHIAAAAVEDETLATANHKVKYNGSVPMCGVVGDIELFDYLGAAQLTAQALAGLPKYPQVDWADIKDTVTAKLFTTFPSARTADGDKYASVMQNLSGGPRPMFDIGFRGLYTGVVWGTFGSDGTVNGIFNKRVADTNRFVYKIDGDQAATDKLNAEVLKITAEPDANRLRRDGLRWVPQVNGEFSVPVVTIHTLGDMYVPFSMEQIYRNRADAKGSGDWLVQRAIRGVGHCDFTLQEQAEAFDAMIAWEAGGPKPEGDDVLTAATVADSAYGCKFTRNDTSSTRVNLAANYPCPAP